MTVRFIAHVEGGRFPDHVRRLIQQAMAKWEGECVEVTVRKHRAKRSNPQNRWIWGVAYPLIAEHLGYDRDEHEDLHYALVAKCFGTRLDERIGAEVPSVRSSKLNTQEFGEYMEWLTRFAAKEWGIVVPLPDEDSEAA